MKRNRLLASLSRADRRHLKAAGDIVDLRDGDILWEAQSRMRRVYFPLDGFISQLIPVATHKNLELALRRQ